MVILMQMIGFVQEYNPAYHVEGRKTLMMPPRLTS
jgi:hypothetical protein